MKQHRLAFSLIELLVVVTMTGILAAMAIPAYQTYRVKSEIGKIIASTAGITDLQVAYLNKKGTFTDRATLGLPADPTNSGCSSCVGLSYIGNNPYVAQIGTAALCPKWAINDVFINSNLTGSSFWLRQRITEINGVIYKDCLLEGSVSITVGPCRNNDWSVANAHQAAAGC